MKNKYQNIMKKVFSILMVAFAMTAMVACGEKDNTDNGSNGGSNNGGGTDTPIDPPATPSSYVIYDGVTYPMYNLDANHVNSSASISMSSAITAFWNRNASPKNQSINLASPAAGNLYWIGIDGSVLNLNAFGSGRDDGTFDGFYEIGDENVNGESAFTSGTYIVYTADPDGEGDAVRIELDGMLKNGKRLQVKLVSGSNNGNNNQ